MSTKKVTAEDSEKERQRAAVLASEGYTQPEIAENIAVSKSTVTRLIKEARDQGILLPQRSPIVHGRIKPEILNRPSDPQLYDDLCRRLKACGVADVRMVGAVEGDPDATRTRVMRRVATVLTNLLQQRPSGWPVIGFTGGSTLRQAIDYTDLESGDAADAILVPLAGDPSLLPDAPDRAWEIQSSANGVVRELGVRLGLPGERTWHFPLPLTWSAAVAGDVPAVTALRALARGVLEVAAILGAPTRNGDGQPLIEQMTTLFAELSPRGPGDPEWTAGRINGHLLARREVGASGLRACEQQNALAPGASPSDLAQVAGRARQHHLSGQGVILVASGSGAA
ncbi:MAG TPA: helix-turn-helix domain-containing protein, partial [Candidatus Udaeobacter sp.]|nr:helix-turn-helix domain-containing protein [Candidatus Udaeobacter sp.]